LTKEKVLANIFSYFLCSNILIIEIWII
jgi:hypothetical protein